MLTGKVHTLDLPVTQKQIEYFEAGYGLLQDIFPDLTPAQREFLKSGTTEEEWNNSLEH